MNIKIQDLRKDFGNKTAVDIADFSIETGNILGLVGNNGAGKTTLFRLLLDLIKADNGNVSMSFETPEGDLLEINPAQSEEWKAYTGAYIDEGFLIDFLTPDEYFQFIGKVNGLSLEETNKRLEPYKQFMSGEILGEKKLIRNFSAGNKQKIGIISALLNKPKLLVLDEPFNFLDPTSQNCLKYILKDFGSQNQATILISSHNLTHTIDVSTRIALLENGKIIKDLHTVGSSAERELEDYFNISSTNKQDESSL